MPRLYANPMRWVWVGRIFLAAYLGVITSAIWLEGAPVNDYIFMFPMLIPMINLFSMGRYTGVFVLHEDVLGQTGSVEVDRPQEYARPLQNCKLSLF